MSVLASVFALLTTSAASTPDGSQRHLTADPASLGAPGILIAARHPDRSTSSNEFERNARQRQARDAQDDRARCSATKRSADVMQELPYCLYAASGVPALTTHGGSGT